MAQRLVTKTSRHRGFARIAREQIRVLEDEMLVHVEMKIGRAPREKKNPKNVPTVHQRMADRRLRS